MKINFAACLSFHPSTVLLHLWKPVANILRPGREGEPSERGLESRNFHYNCVELKSPKKAKQRELLRK